MPTSLDRPRVLSGIPGRLRLHLPVQRDELLHQMVRQLQEMPGIRRVMLNALTGNVLIHYNASVLTEPALIACVDGLRRDPLSAGAPPAADGPPIALRGEVLPAPTTICQRASAGRPRHYMPARSHTMMLLGKGASIALSLILAESPLGLLLGGLEALHLLVETVGRWPTRQGYASAPWTGSTLSSSCTTCVTM